MDVWADLLVLMPVRRVVAVGLCVREDLDGDGLRSWTHAVGAIQMGVLLDVADVLPPVVLFLGQRHDGGGDLAFAHASLEHRQVIVLLRLHLPRLCPDPVLLVLILDLQVQVLLQLHRLLRQLLGAACCTTLLSHSGLRCEQ